MRSLRRFLLFNLALLAGPTLVQAGEMSTQNQEYFITKDLVGASGASQVTTLNGTYSLAFAWGEPVSGNAVLSSTREVVSGYLGGRFGNGNVLRMLSARVGTPGVKTFFQESLQVGVPFDAPIHMTFSDQLDEETISYGIRVVMAVDHMGREVNILSSYTYVTDPALHTITIRPEGQWLGNTFYDIQLTPDLRSVDGFPHDPADHVTFVTMLNPAEENVVANPMKPRALPVLGQGPGAMSMHIPSESLSDYSAVLLNRNPLLSPLRVNPAIIHEANEKARQAGGPYRVPVAIQEITAYDKNGNLVKPLSQTAELSIQYATHVPFPLRTHTLALWVLDEEHRLWVKIPASQNTPDFQTVTAPVTRFSVFALMGSPAGSAADTFVFPVPWRPHGPHAGQGIGQSGTYGGGITFSNVPSECTITIFTLSGDLVRTLAHSDIAGAMAQEIWDVKTDGGENVASGVYLWRVESREDGKNGKLMVIR